VGLRCDPEVEYRFSSGHFVSTMIPGAEVSKRKESLF
jgi:hypothetical protein